MSKPSNRQLESLCVDSLDQIKGAVTLSITEWTKIVNLINQLKGVSTEVFTLKQSYNKQSIEIVWNQELLKSLLPGKFDEYMQANPELQGTYQLRRFEDMYIFSGDVARLTPVKADAFEPDTSETGTSDASVETGIEDVIDTEE